MRHEKRRNNGRKAALDKEQETLQRNKDLLQAINRAQTRFIDDADTFALFDNLLNDILRLTESEYGFIGEVLYTEQDAPYLKTHAVTNIAWNRETRAFYKKHAPAGMEFRNLKTLFGAVLTTGRPVIANDPATDPRRGGLPEGHPPLNAFLGIPFFHGKTMNGCLGIANRPGGYDEALLDFLAPLLATCANIIEGNRLLQRRKAADEALRNSEGQYRRSERKLARSNRALRIVSQCNEALIHAVDERSLLQDICRIIIETEGYRLAWIGYAEDDEGKTVRPVAHGGFNNGYLETVKISWADVDHGRGPTGTAIRTGRECVVHNILDDANFVPWRSEAFKRGYASILSVPLKDEDYTTGALTLYSEENDAFHEEEIRLFQELSANLSYGIRSLRMREEHRISEQERRKLEDHVRQAQKLEAIGTLAGGIAHDFNNLLNVINGFAGLVKEEFPEGSRQRGDVEAILNAGRRASELVQQILTFSHGVEQERHPLNLQFVIKDVLKFLGRSLPSTIEIWKNIRPDCGPVVADVTQVRQVIMNLCTNAFHAMRNKGGILSIELDETDIDRAQTVAVKGLSEGRYVRLTVSDTGSGMDRMTMERIFDPYFTTKKPGEGTGLGLATVHGIVKGHGGVITVRSELGRGAAFTVYLPVAKGESIPDKMEKKEVEVRPQLTAHVLFVDDVVFNVQLGRQVLEKFGCRVTGVSDSLEALALFRENPDRFDIVVTDQTMPGLTGLDLAGKMLQIRPDLPIIMVTGFSETVDEERAKELGIKAFFSKPLDIANLAATIGETLS